MEIMPNITFQTGIWRPVSIEYNQVELQIIGSLPEDLQGLYYRNGPNPFVLNTPGYHLFDGDGMIHCFNIKEGKAFYSNKWIETEKYTIESHFKKKIFHYYREYIEKYAGKISIHGDKSGSANTSIIFFNNKLYALHESSSPIQIDPMTLKNIGKWDFVGDNSWKIMSAHPKICPITQYLNTYCYEPLKKELTYYCLSSSGELINFFKINIPYVPLLIHDFAITKDYVIFIFFPLVVEPSSSENKIHDIMWRPEYKTLLVVYSKQDGELICSHPVYPTYSYHFINAYQEEDFIMIDLFFYEGDFKNEEFWEPLNKPSVPHRIVLDLKNDNLKIEKLAFLSGDFATVEARYVGQKYDKFFMCASTLDTRPTFEYNAIIAFDLNTRQHTIFDFGEHAYCSEPLVVTTSNKTLNNDSRYLLNLVHDNDKNLSQLVIFLADNIEKGPICRLLVKSRIPFGFHGVWVPS